MLDKKLLSILVCPVTKRALIWDAPNNELVSLSAGLAYPVRDDIPVMLEGEAREITLAEKETWQNK